jgi:hypothetical protein
LQQESIEVFDMTKPKGDAHPRALLDITVRLLGKQLKVA